MFDSQLRQILKFPYLLLFLRKDAGEIAAFPEGKHDFEDEEFANVVPPIRLGDACCGRFEEYEERNRALIPI